MSGPATAVRDPKSLYRKARTIAYRAKPKVYFYDQWDADPFSIRPLTLLDRPAAGPSRSAPLLVHVAHFGKNAGDRVLPIMTRDVLSDAIGPHRWVGRPVHHRVNRLDLALINRSTGVVIGGGGLFLRDTNPNELSGWQWSCSVEDLASIRVPIVVFAVGYNRFREQEDFTPLFTEHLTELTERSAFLGLRNTGSVEAVRSYLPEPLRAKVRLQPCTTTVARRLYPGDWSQWPDPLGPSDRPTIGLNCAFDREQLRFGGRTDEVLASLARGLAPFAADCRIVYYAHRVDDERALPVLRANGIDPTVVRLQDMHAGSILATYRRADVMLGMRGHAQLIPFGCGRPIISLVSHDKMRFFLEDIGFQDRAVEVLDADVSDQITAQVGDVLGDLDREVARVDEAMDRLWAITQQNLDDTIEAFGIARTH